MFKESLPYNNGCPKGYHKRKSYTVKKTGKFVPIRCVRSTTVYNESSSEFKNRVTARARARLSGLKRLGTSKKCPPGHILRKPYIRRFKTSIKLEGYTVKRGNKTYRVYPKKNSTVVKASCIKNHGLPGKGPNSIGPLRRGDLSKYGYNAKKDEYMRHSSLRRAIEEYGALGVFHKLDAIAKLSVRRSPEASNTFKKDRDWVRATFSLKAFA
jgi:DNA-directed RNA polymerase subunit N (RpoN/RPB10)